MGVNSAVDLVRSAGVLAVVGVFPVLKAVVALPIANKQGWDGNLTAVDHVALAAQPFLDILSDVIAVAAHGVDLGADLVQIVLPHTLTIHIGLGNDENGVLSRPGFQNGTAVAVAGEVPLAEGGPVVHVLVRIRGVGLVRSGRIEPGHSGVHKRHLFLGCAVAALTGGDDKQALALLVHQIEPAPLLQELGHVLRTAGDSDHIEIGPAGGVLRQVDVDLPAGSVPIHVLIGQGLGKVSGHGQLIGVAVIVGGGGLAVQGLGGLFLFGAAAVQFGLVLGQEPVHHAGVAARVVVAVLGVKVLAQAVLGVAVCGVVQLVVVVGIPQVGRLHGGVEAALVHVRIELIVEIRKADIVLQPLRALAGLLVVLQKCLIHHFRSQRRGNEVVDALEEPQRHVVLRGKLEDLLMDFHRVFFSSQCGAVAAVLNDYRSDVIRTVPQQSGSAPRPLRGAGDVDPVPVHRKLAECVAQRHAERVVPLIAVRAGAVAAVVLGSHQDHVVIAHVLGGGPHAVHHTDVEMDTRIVQLRPGAGGGCAVTLTGAVGEQEQGVLLVRVVVIRQLIPDVDAQTRQAGLVQVAQQLVLSQVSVVNGSSVAADGIGGVIVFELEVRQHLVGFLVGQVDILKLVQDLVLNVGLVNFNFFLTGGDLCSLVALCIDIICLNHADVIAFHQVLSDRDALLLVVLVQVIVLVGDQSHFVKIVQLYDNIVARFTAAVQQLRSAVGVDPGNLGFSLFAGQVVAGHQDLEALRVQLAGIHREGVLQHNRLQLLPKMARGGQSLDAD